MCSGRRLHWLFGQWIRTSCPLTVLFCTMQDKRRRNDFASTEVGEVKGGRVTQQAFAVAHKKDSGISMQRCQEREATGGRTPRKMARLKDPAPASFSVPLIFDKGRGEKPGRQSTTQAQGLKIFSYAEATRLTARGTRACPTEVTHNRHRTSKQRADQQSERGSDTSLKLVVYSAARFQ